MRASSFSTGESGGEETTQPRCLSQPQLAHNINRENYAPPSRLDAHRVALDIYSSSQRPDPHSVQPSPDPTLEPKAMSATVDDWVEQLAYRREV